MSRSGRGFEDDARQRVIDAARRSGVSVGELVQALSRPTVRDRSVDDRRIDEGFDRPRTRERISRADRWPAASNEAALEEIAATVGRLAGAERSRTSSRDPDTGRILDTLEALDRRVRALGEAAPRTPASLSLIHI